jgi:hypothetical protein
MVINVNNIKKSHVIQSPGKNIISIIGQSQILLFLVVEDDECDLSGKFTQLVVESYVMSGN